MSHMDCCPYGRKGSDCCYSNLLWVDIHTFQLNVLQLILGVSPQCVKMELEVVLRCFMKLHYLMFSYNWKGVQEWCQNVCICQCIFMVSRRNGPNNSSYTHNTTWEPWHRILTWGLMHTLLKKDCAVCRQVLKHLVFCSLLCIGFNSLRFADLGALFCYQCSKGTVNIKPLLHGQQQDLSIIKE